ncbi:NAD(P)-binding protein [cf. Phormidesmis sp. LEGE 11477]|uniref:NAD(P)-binding protein n=1 Tax=cf. Phormidesmis sp. LEGE 11477 TaxID=1828680 RepID=UPI00187E6BCF|nr:NAD(P)-binding protein [cf. Phormidesmis sp. LEGE 11477]MBE9062488.1 NAD(P)-binding protein [cf. Phormidesmis sp. LEGE 11477]
MGSQRRVAPTAPKTVSSKIVSSKTASQQAVSQTLSQSQAQACSPTLVLGADPAGLATAYQLSQFGELVHVISPDTYAGGYARTEIHGGYRCKLSDSSYLVENGLVKDGSTENGLIRGLEPGRTAGDRSLGNAASNAASNDSAVEEVWQVLAGDFKQAEMRSAVYYRDRIFTCPLSATNAIKHLGPINVALTGLGYLQARLSTQLNPGKTAETAQSWLIEQFGSHLYQIFFEPYFQKIWGVSAARLTADCAKRSIQDGFFMGSARLSRSTVLTKADYSSAISPSVWEDCQRQIEAIGSAVSLETDIVSIEHNSRQITKVITCKHSGNLPGEPLSEPLSKPSSELNEYSPGSIFSSLPLSDFIQRLDPPAPASVQLAAGRLQYRHVIVVPLLVKLVSALPENWLHVHSPEVSVSRIQTSSRSQPYSDRQQDCNHANCLGLSYLCDESDPVWQMSDAALIDLAIHELITLRLVADASSCQSLSSTVMRQQRAYPVSTVDADKSLAVVQTYLSKFENLQMVGMNKQHCYQSQNHCLLDGLTAAAARV